MIERSSSAMPKAAFFVYFLFCGNFILSGKTAEQCPKNPLSPTNSVSGMVVGTIVGVEKVVNGVMSYFYYLGENSVNQVIGVTSKVGDLVSKYTIKIQDFASGIVGSIGGQIKSIYNGSTGSIRVLFDQVMKMENSAQSFVYKQVQSFSEKVVSGKITGEISQIVKNPLKSISTSLKKTKESTKKVASSIKSDIKKMVEKVKTSGVPSDVKDIIGAPVRGVKEFAKESQTAIKSVKNETSEKFSGYAKDFQSGGVIDKLVAVGSFPVGITMETWSLTLKVSSAVRKSVSISVKDVVQPFLGQVLTERLGKIVMLPMDLTEGLYKTAVNTVHQVGGVISKVTGGGKVSVQINMVIKHPVTVIKNALKTTKEEIKDFSKASLGEELTEQLGSALSSPGKAIQNAMQSLTNGQLSVVLNSVIDTPVMYLKKGVYQAKMTIGGISKGLIGDKLTAKISKVLNAPGKFISDTISSITGGGTISLQIKTVLTQPIQTLKNIGSTAKNKTEELVTSITGGGSLSEQISTVFTKPVTFVKNIWSSTKSSIMSISKSLTGGDLTKEVGKVFSSPLATLSNITASITGGGSLGTQIKMVFTKPVDLAKNVWSKAKMTTDSVMKILLGDKAKNTISNLFKSPLQTISNITASVTGGGSLGTQIKMIFTKPVDLVKNVWSKAKMTTDSVMKIFLGDNAKNTISNLFKSPLQTISKLYKSTASSVSSIGRGFGASISISGGGGGGGGGSISGAFKSIINAPLAVVKGTLNGIQSGQKSLISGLKAFYSSIPIIGKGYLKIEVKDGDEKAEVNIGGDAKAKGKSGGEAEAKSEGKAGAKSDGKAKAKSEGKAEAKSEGKAGAKSDGKAKAKSEGKAEAKSEGKAETKSEGESEAKSEGKAKAKSEGKAEAKAEGSADVKVE